jgi:hypothetical protein
MTTEQKPPTCGDCEYCHRWPGNQGLCQAPSPICVYGVSENTTLRHVFYSAEASYCDCFKKKAAK